MTDYALISKYIRFRQLHVVIIVTNYPRPCGKSLATFGDIVYRTRGKLKRDVTMLCGSSDPGHRNTIRDNAAASLVSKVLPWGN